MKIKKNLDILLVASVIAAASACQAVEESYVSDTQSTATSSISTDVVLSEEQMAQAFYIPGTAVVKFSEQMTERIEAALAAGKDADGIGGISKIAAELGIRNLEREFPYAGEFEPRTRREGLHRFYIVDFDESVSLTKAQRLFEEVEGVEMFEMQHRTAIKDINDPGYSQLWGMYTGNGVNINVAPVWDITMGDPRVKVCIVDGGVQLDHPDLSWNVAETGHYNFVKGNRTITADSHGTHVAGTIAAVGNNGLGVVGVAGGNYAKNKRGVSLISAQVFSGESSARSFASAVKWGADNGAVISQNSWGYDYDYNNDGQLTGTELTAALAATIETSLKTAVDYFIKYAGCDNNGEQLPDSPMKGGLVIFAAGNDGIANGAPANYEPIVSVGAVTRTGNLADYSNYGPWVDICAPGTYIYSTWPGGKYESLSGTSMACPHVSGAAALLLSQFGRPGMSNSTLEDILKSGANEKKISYNGRKCGPFLDVYSSYVYGVSKMGREFNTDPVIETDFGDELVFRQWESVKLPIRIYDPDGDKVRVEAEIEGRAKLTPDPQIDTVYYFQLLCQLVNDFKPQKVTITATDIFDAVVTREFTYKVLENREPETKNNIDDVLMEGIGIKKEIDLSEVFIDPDDEPLRYNVSLSKNNVLDFVTDNDNKKITIESKNMGLVTVTVTAYDSMNKKTTASFKVLTREKGTQMEVYPNPVSDYLYVRTGSTPENAKVRLTTSTGSAVYNGELRCSAFEPGQIDMRSCAPGQYHISITTGGKTTEKTIIKK